jgi:hypothetical protein
MIWQLLVCSGSIATNILIFNTMKDPRILNVVKPGAIYEIPTIVE